MSEYMCPRCRTRYTFNEYMKLLRIKAVDDDPDPDRNYGYTTACGCGYRFHKDKPYHQTHYEFDHHITLFHWLFNKLSLGRFCRPIKITGMVSAVFLELNHDLGGCTPGGVFWEVMPFANADREWASPLLGSSSSLDTWNQYRGRTMEEIERLHGRMLDLLLDGRYIIRYSLGKIWEGDEWTGKWETDRWVFEVDGQYRRIFHSVRQTEDDKREWI
jgi:hypothetical protein